MIQNKIGGIEIADLEVPQINTDPYIIALFAEENCGKTRFTMTGKELIGCVPLEMKAYKTLDKDSAVLGKKLIKPKDPMSLIVNIRSVSIRDNHKQQLFYLEHVKKVEDYIFALLAHKDVHTIMIDKFTTYCTWKEYAINGMTEKYIKVEGKVYKDKKEVNQGIIDFLNSLSQWKKTVILTNATKDDYDVVGPDKKPIRRTWDSFKYLGSHCNLVCELVDNKHWDVNKPDSDKHNWHYGLSVRRCQDQ